MDKVVVKNDISPVMVAILVGGKELVLDPDIYTMKNELQVKRVLAEAAKLEEEGKKVEALELSFECLSTLVLRSNADWTKEELGDKITSQQIGWALGFFEILGPSGGRMEREVVDRIAQILTTGKVQEEATTEDLTSTTKTPETPTE